MRLDQYFEKNEHAHQGQILVSPDNIPCILSYISVNCGEGICLVTLSEDSVNYHELVNTEWAYSDVEGFTKQEVIYAISGTPNSYDKTPKDETFLKDWKIFDFNDFNELIQAWIKRQEEE